MILCVTGPMAAGKNVAASILEKKGFAAIDADVLGHRAVKECTEQILCEFSDEAQKRGVSLLSSDGTLNRRVLGSIVFESRELLARQEQIVYPVIRRLLAEFIRENAGKDIAVNATVLYKLPDMQNIIERILYIDAPLPLRFIRAMKRDKTGIHKKDIIGRAVFRFTGGFRHKKIFLLNIKIQIPILEEYGIPARGKVLNAR